MLKITSPDKLAVIHDSYTALNQSYIRLFLTAARTRDPIASHLLGIDPAVLAEYSNANSYDLISADKIGAPLVRPLLRDPAALRDAIEGRFSAAQMFAQYFYRPPTSLGSITCQSGPAPDATIAVQTAIKDLNEKLIKLILTIASTNDVIASLLLRLEPNTIDAYAELSAYDVQKLSQIGLPLARPILTDPTSVRACFTSGCSTSIVLQRLSRDTPDIKRHSQSIKSMETS
jgi:hypothetical protein